MKKPGAPVVAASGGPAPGALRPGDWRCPTCSDMQFARNQTCRRCGAQQPTWLGSTLSMAPPEYWTVGGPESDGPSLRPWVVVPVADAETEALRVGMVPGGTLGGRDQRTRLDYSGFRLVQAWRLQHPGLWGKYAMERENVRKLEAPSLEATGIPIPQVDVRRAYREVARKLPAPLDDVINEVTYPTARSQRAFSQS